MGRRGVARVAGVKREVVIRRVVAGKLNVTEAALLLGLSQRQVWRLHSRYVEQGPSALAHGNRGRAPANKTRDALRTKVARLARTRYAGCNDSHLAELLVNARASRSALGQLELASQRVEARQHLDGSWSVHAPDGRELAHTAVPVGAVKLLAQDYVRRPIAGVPSLPWRPGPEHPWKNDRRTRITPAQRRLIIARQG